jgi:protein-disulfide isomerase
VLRKTTRNYVAVGLVMAMSGGLEVHAQKTSRSSERALDELRSNIRRVLYSELLVPRDATITLGPLQAGAIAGYDTISVSFSTAGRQHVEDYLISHDRKTIARLKEFALTDDPVKSITVDNVISWGNAAAPVKILIFMDYQCPFCALMHKRLTQEALAKYKDKIWIAYKDFPLESHKGSLELSIMGHCIADQSLEAARNYVDTLYAGVLDGSRQRRDTPGLIEEISNSITSRYSLNGLRLSACMRTSDVAGINKSAKEGASEGVEATPTLFVNGERVLGVMNKSDLWTLIDRKLDEVESEHASAP